MASRDSCVASSPEVGRRLLDWFDRERRDLPWRLTRDPYRVWVSEIMLQQTRVERVIPFYLGFLSRFPTVEALAEASIESVLATWSGLGYYRRARLLHAAAREVARRGALPRRESEWRRLPGVGPYTAAAIASIASGERVAAIDANAERVLARLVAADDTRSAAGRRRIAEVAHALLDSERPGDSNQALMDLGSTLCQARAVRCEECPLKSCCQSFRAGTALELPRRREATRRVKMHRLAVLVRRSGKLLLVRRSDDAEILAGMWEVPWVRWAQRGRAESALARKYGGLWELGTRHGSIRHSITYRDLEIDVWSGQIDAGKIAEDPAAGWFDGEERRRVPTPSWVDKALARSLPVASS